MAVTGSGEVQPGAGLVRGAAGGGGADVELAMSAAAQEVLVVDEDGVVVAVGGDVTGESGAAGGEPGGPGEPGEVAGRGAGGRRRRRQNGGSVRTERVTTRFSVAELELVRGAAALGGGMSVGGWLTATAVGTAAAQRSPLPSSVDEVVGELRGAVRQLVRYGVLLNQLVAQVNAGGDVARLAGGLRIAVDRCEQRSVDVALLAGELAATAGVTGLPVPARSSPARSSSARSSARPSSAASPARPLCDDGLVGR